MAIDFMQHDWAKQPFSQKQRIEQLLEVCRLASDALSSMYLTAEAEHALVQLNRILAEVSK